MTDISDFSGAVSEILDDFSDDVQEALEESVEESVKIGRKKVRSNSASLFGSGKYSRGWKYKVVKGFLSTTGIVYNGGSHGGLTQLLEKPHALRGGGRWIPPASHIDPANNEMQEAFIRKFKEKV